ncbi:MAG: DNA repair protein RecN [Candidatus Nitrospinota bacterium M3_3B_026]
MLKELYVKDFAIVDEARVEFAGGLNALTGETGAGKSILVEALGLALGGRSSEEMIRSGAERAVVEALFDTDDVPGLPAWLAEQGLEGDGGGLLIRRIITRTGKNRTYINGAMATVAQLRAAGETLVDIHGQNEHQTLLRPKAHLPFLDSFLGIEGERGKFQEKFDEYRSAAGKLASLKKDQRETERRMDLLRFQVNEIDAASLAPGEDEALAAEKSRLSNVEALMELAAGAAGALDGGDRAASALLGAARAAVERMAQLDETLVPLASELVEISLRADEAAAELSRHADGIERDPDRLAEVDDRLDMIKNLKKKYGGTIEDILAFRDQAAAELAGLELAGQSADELEKKAAELGRETARLALALDEKRRGGADRFAKAVRGELAGLNMGKARVELAFAYGDDPESPARKDGRGVKMSRDGIGQVEILFSSNPGSPPKPFVKVASGGEMSRLMLALKTVLHGKQPAPVIVFDEIDAGIGGVTADRLGEKLRELAGRAQVFCVTHLPQVARQAHAHYSVEKHASRGKTGVVVAKLDRGGRVAELARMAGGGTAKESAIKWAEEALEQS